MFRKPKKNAKKAGLRRKKQEPEDDDDKETSRELAQARKRAKTGKEHDDDDGDGTNGTTTTTTTTTTKASSTLHSFEASKDAPISQKDMATSTNQLHPEKAVVYKNKFLAGPIRAATHIRTTSRFDYQPDICKDYKDTGFCGFGDTCIYLHDRGDTMSGWQLEQQWEKQQNEKKQKQQEQMDAFLDGGTKKKEEATFDADDGLPFACHICRTAFTDPVVTRCAHYFCEKCILQHIQSNNSTNSSQLCPVCNKDTHGVLNQPTKLLSKKRKVVGRDASWQDYLEKCQSRTASTEKDEDSG